MKSIGIAAVLAVSLWGFAVQPSGSLFENDQVKVTRALERPHVKGSFHEHKTNRVMVYLEGGRQRFEYKDGRKTADFDWKAGQVAWSEPDGIHSPEVITDEPFNIVEIELKKPGGGTIAKDASGADRRHYKLEFEKPQVRVLRLKLAPHESTPLVETTAESVVVFLNDQEFRTTGADGKSETVTHKPGDAVWQSAGKAKIENTGSTPLEMVFVELKN
ncbi:MAG TPA: hypothetical protein VHC90_07250 [Bryobacteraceae bacterium]|nr:hypothetical protein [Bryobacteraceae bacterium]